MTRGVLWLAPPFNTGDLHPRTFASWPGRSWIRANGAAILLSIPSQRAGPEEPAQRRRGVSLSSRVAYSPIPASVSDIETDSECSRLLLLNAPWRCDEAAAWPVSYPLRLSGAAGGLRRGRPSCACSRSRGSRWSRTARLESRCAGRRSPAVFIEAPAGGRAVDPDSAAVVLAGVDGNELALGRCGLTRSITASARDGGVGTQAARVVLEAHADGDELTLRWCGLIEEVVAPAGEGAVGPHSTGVVVAGAGGRECTVGRRRLSVIIAPPVRDGAVGPHAARVILPRRRRTTRHTARCLDRKRTP